MEKEDAHEDCAFDRLRFFIRLPAGLPNKGIPFAYLSTCIGN